MLIVLPCQTVSSRQGGKKQSAVALCRVHHQKRDLTLAWSASIGPALVHGFGFDALSASAVVAPECDGFAV
jgi:hypothetical protein